MTIRQLNKHYGALQALHDVDLMIKKGSVHAFVGENGAGKSTLGKIISGVVRPDDDGGEIVVNGRSVSYSSPFDALSDGITIISQEIALVPKLSVEQNVFLGLENNHGGLWLRHNSIRQRYEALSKQTGFSLPPDRLVTQLSFAEQKQAEILKAIARDAKLIVMDEPTAALPAGETKRLLEIIKQLNEDGVTILFISHFLEEVLQVADTVSVFRDGELIKTTPAHTETAATLVTAMLGRELSLAFPPKQLPPDDAPILFSAHNITRQGRLHNISLDIRRGEIVGLAGLVGSGRTELARAIFGADPIDNGRFSLNDVPIQIKSPNQAVNAGLAMVPESRKTEGLLLNFPVVRNITLPHLNQVSHSGFVNSDKEFTQTTALLQQLDVRPADPNAPINGLSGGNQQKSLFGKWLFKKPQLLIIDEPTHGVDVGARRAIYQLITRLAADGMGIILISSEIEEIIGLSHRVLVMRQGKIVTEFSDNQSATSELAEEAIMRAAFAAG